MNFEETILRNLLLNAPYRDRVLAFLDTEYFDEPVEKMLFTEIDKFIQKYKTPPSREALALIINDRGDLGEDMHTSSLGKIKTITTNSNTEKNLEWLIDESEKYCQERALYNAISSSIEILEGRDDKREKTIIPEMLKDALGVNFKLTLGHRYKEDADIRFDFYANDKTHIPCDLHMINKITNGGVWPVSLNVPIADTGVGKSIFLCHLAASYMSAGLNVIYFTMEMGELSLSHRIDANLMDIAMDDFNPSLDKNIFDAQMKRIKNNFTGNIRIKEFGSGNAHAGHFRQVVDEYEMKEGFKSDIILIDYLGICASERLKISNTRPDLYLQSIAEELRNLSKNVGVPVWSPHQTNRDGSETVEVNKKNVGGSYGIMQTSDITFAIVTSKDLKNRGQVLIKQLKNRYADENSPDKFLLGLDKTKMRFYNLDSQTEAMVESKSEKSKERLQENRKIKSAVTGLRF